MTSFKPEEKDKLALMAGKVFTPATPVSNQELFAGRIQQVRRVVDAIGQDSNHLIIFGERGVGKTSFSNILPFFVQLKGEAVVLPVRVNCDSGDTFSSVCRKILKGITLTKQIQQAGFTGGKSPQPFSLAKDYLPEYTITPDDMLQALTPIGQQCILMCIIDEFDRINNNEDKRLFADLIKTLSDYNAPATIILVGVADNVTELIAEHESIERALVQVQMPRMNNGEITQIIDKGTNQLQLKIDEEAKRLIVALSKGLPHYTHLLGLYASRCAIDNGSNKITVDLVQSAISTALENSQQSTKVKYQQATYSPRETIYPAVLLACALAESNDLGYFTANSVCAPLSQITGKKYTISGFAKNLNDLSTEQRGSILQQNGEPRKRYYRFSNPLMQPYIIMNGLSNKMIDKTVLKES